MKYENWISYRYLVSSKGRFLSFLNFISIAGVAIGVASLIVVTGVMTGFGNNIREKIIGTTPHIMIEKETGLEDYEDIIDRVLLVDGVESASAYVQGNVFLESSTQAIGLIARGIVPSQEINITKVDEYISKGSLDDLGDNNVIIGSELARYFGYDVNDEIVIIAPGSGISGKGWRYKLKIVGVFSTGMADYDMNLIILNIKQAQQIFNMESNVASGVGVKLHDPNLAGEIKEGIYDVLGYSFLIKSWIDVNRNLFEALFLEKWGLFLVLTFMVIIASFNIISTLIVMVTTKIYDIGILKAIGASKKSIRKIFVKQGMLIGSLGTFYGVVGGVGISYVLRTWVKVPKEIYTIDRVPVEIQLFDMVVIVSAVIVISYFATIYPAAKAANLEPVEALRYE